MNQFHKTKEGNKTRDETGRGQIMKVLTPDQGISIRTQKSKLLNTNRVKTCLTYTYTYIL